MKRTAALLALSTLCLVRPPLAGAISIETEQITSHSVYPGTGQSLRGVATGPDGRIYIAWQDLRANGVFQIFLKSRLPEESWEGDAFPVSQGPSDARNAVLAVDLDAVLHVVWEDRRDGEWQLYYRGYHPGVGWDSAETRLSPGAGPSLHPVLVADGDRRLHLVWSDFSTGVADVRYREYDPARGWLEPLPLSENPGFSLNPYLDVGPDGSVHVVWQDDTPGLGLPATEYRFEIFYRKRTPAGGWENAVQLTDKGSHSRSPVLAVDPTGILHVFWLDNRLSLGTSSKGRVFEMFYKKKHPHGVWMADRRFTYSGANLQNESAYAEADGTIRVFWEDYRLGNARIYTKAITEAYGWDPVDTPLTDSPGVSWVPSVAKGPAGRVHLLWADSRTGRFEIFYGQSLPGGTVPVALLRAGAARAGGTVVLEWATSFEERHAGFHVYRSLDPEGPYTRLSGSLVRGEGTYRFVDPAPPDGNPVYKLGAVAVDGSEEFFGPWRPGQAWEAAPPRALVLSEPFPNPFSSRAFLEAEAVPGLPVEARVLAVDGRLVRRLPSFRAGVGEFTLSWDGRTETGEAAASGVYFLEVTAGGERAVRKILLQRTAG